ncbi:MAG: AI-2E family transporter [Planctomycetaceae bacterium]|nr:MAG: AI-2E family transporter [Planctomycetaceae bacterium]
MTRFVSIAVIIGLVAIFGLLSLRVMSGFLLPLLLAAMLGVIFGPMHRWILSRIRGPQWVAAAITMTIVLLIVFVPVALLGVRAVGEAVKVFRNPNMFLIDQQKIAGLIDQTNEMTGLQLTGDGINAELKKLAEEWLGPIAARTPRFLLQGIIGLIVMAVSLFYFLADGRRMIDAIMRLIPLDALYQRQLLEEFEEVSRAVVSSTLAAAVVQALLAGIGFWFAGLQSVFLLTVLTFFFALVPFVGAAVVWGSASFYLYAIMNQWVTAIALAVWGLLVVSTADNVIKPIVLHGQSKLHPLLALLSVLGGVSALGPIGILVGPIAVAFLQAALTMLQAELGSLSVNHVHGTPHNQGNLEKNG